MLPDMALARGYAEQLMTSTVTFSESGVPVTDPDTGAVVSGGTPVYSGKCRVRPAEIFGTQLEVSGEAVYSTDYLVSIPFAEVGVREGHEGRIDASTDPWLVGVALRVEAVAAGDNVTARRLLCRKTAD
jgi:hypothetical protein